MRSTSLFLSLLAASIVQAFDTPALVKRAFIQSGLVPEVLPTFNPVLLLDVTYTSPASGEKIVITPPGKNLSRPDTQFTPTWSIPSFNPLLAKETFVVAMVDPDAPTPQTPTNAQIRHFLGGNFKLQGRPTGFGLGAALVNSTPALSEYRQPTPPNTSDAHRYTWLLFRQPKDFPTTPLTTPIQLFNISAFAEEFKLGPALAGNFMQVSTKVDV